MSDSPKFEVPANGKTWQVVPPTGRVKKEFVRWFKQQTRAELNEARADIGEDAYQAQLSLHLSSAGAGLYCWQSPVVQQSLKLPGSPARLHLLLLILLQNHPALTADDPEDNPAEAIYEDNPAEFDASLDSVLAPVPNSQPPAEIPGAKKG